MNNATRRAAEELRWYWTEAAGAMGARSNFEPMRARLETGRVTGGAATLEVDERRLDAATRARLIRRTLEAMRPADARLLFSAFGRDERELAGLGHATGVIPVLLSTRRAWLDSGTSRPLEEWLARLVIRAAAKDGRAAVALRVLLRDAESTLDSALSRFVACRGSRSSAVGWRSAR
jgi:hypothetical protein